MMDAQWSVKLRTEEALQQTRSAILDALNDVFQNDIVVDAVENSPYKTGTNRRSIDATVEETPEGYICTLFTQSGYGGYLELGTVKMPARPYLYPAFNKFIEKLKEIVGEKIRAIKPGMFIGPGQE